MNPLIHPIKLNLSAIEPTLAFIEGMKITVLDSFWTVLPGEQKIQIVSKCSDYNSIFRCPNCYTKGQRVVVKTHGLWCCGETIIKDFTCKKDVERFIALMTAKNRTLWFNIDEYIFNKQNIVIGVK